ncbi:MAG: hypothetical protein WCO56_18435 [Verrucomicrobiota bacterium]
MKLVCLTGHQWAGCTCTRCGKVRDTQHEVVRQGDGCKLRCQKCGLPVGFEHDWEGCACQRCGEERHRWLGGKCIACNLRDDSSYFIHVCDSAGFVVKAR